jgi:uncharacterized protein
VKSNRGSFGSAYPMIARQSWGPKRAPLRMTQELRCTEVAYAEGMALDWNAGGLAEGLRCYRNREFWVAHEHWESVWLRLEEPEKNFLQALIQTTAAFHHLQAGNSRGAVSLLGKALRRVEAYPAWFGGIDLARLRTEAGAWLAALEGGDGPRPAEFPEICLIQGPGNRQQGTGNRQQATGNRQQAIGNREQGTENRG